MKTNAAYLPNPTQCSLPALATDILNTHDSVRGTVRVKLANLIAKYRPASCTRIGSTEDLYSETYNRLAKKQYVCNGTGKAISLATRIAKNLLADNARQREFRSKIAVPMQSVERQDATGQEQDCSNFEYRRATEAAHDAEESMDMRDLMSATSNQLRGLDPIDSTIFDAISDYVTHSRNVPSDREIAEVLGEKQNTVTVRRNKLQVRIQKALQELGYSPQSKGRPTHQPPIPCSPMFPSRRGSKANPSMGSREGMHSCSSGSTENCTPSRAHR